MGALTVDPRGPRSRSPDSEPAATPDPAGSDSDPAESEDAEDPTDPEPCAWTTIGGDGTCLEAEKLSYLAELACGAVGLGVASIHAVIDCAGGASTSAQVECCGSAPEAPAEPDPTPKCETLAIGDGIHCAAVDGLKNEAAQVCASMKMEMATFDAVPDCPGGESSNAKVTCCSPTSAVDPGPSAQPVHGVLGDGTTCMPDSVLVEEALDVCAAEGLMLLDCLGAQDCGTGVSSYAKYTCIP